MIGPISLNDRALRLTECALSDAAVLNVSVSTIAGARVIDAGVQAYGGYAAGRMMAQVCMADLGDVSIVPGDFGPAIQITTDHPVAACLASQYAGWQVSVEKWFGMGSGPMRAAYGKEPLFDDIGFRESSTQAVGVFEADKLPTEAVVNYLADKLKLPSDRLTLWVAPTGSLAGTVQVVARSVEVALHKLHELHFDLKTIRYGYGIAPLPPATMDNFKALGWTNDDILYGGRVELIVETDDNIIKEFGPKTPSCASQSFGKPFAKLFEEAGDFYKMDPQIFAPAMIRFHNRRTGHTMQYGKLADDVLRKSFGW